jgi:hypothetical protein
LKVSSWGLTFGWSATGSRRRQKAPGESERLAIFSRFHTPRHREHRLPAIGGAQGYFFSIDNVPRKLKPSAARTARMAAGKDFSFPAGRWASFMLLSRL